MTEVDQKVSDNLVRLIQIIFGLVLAQSLVRYDKLVLKPIAPANLLGSFALLGVYITTVLSWIDWHITMALRPYNLNRRIGRLRLHNEQARVLSDLLIVTIYAFLLLAVGEFASNPNRSIHLYLLGYVLVFAGYAISGHLRRFSYGKLASRLWLIYITALSYSLLLGAYLINQESGWIDLAVSNYLAVVLTILLMVSYRVIRRVASDMARIKKEGGLRIGFDVDGVLADQITGVLPRIKRRLNVDLTYDDITQWDLPIGESDIAKEILAAMEDPDYVLEMPAHSGALDVINSLYANHRIHIMTARPHDAEQWTQAWLDKHGMSIDQLSSVAEKGKSLYATDVLVDDYLGNVEEYLKATNGVAILVDRPWNGMRSTLYSYLEDGRLYVVRSLEEIPPLIESIQSRLNAGDE